MRDKSLGLAKLVIFGIIFGMLCTGLVYWRFPRFLCYAVYDVSESDLYQKENREMAPGTCLVEYFVPRYRYLTGVHIHVNQKRKEDSGNIVTGRLLDSKQRVLAQSGFAPEDEFFEFKFNRWVSTDEEYQMEIIFPEENGSPVITTFGPEDIGPDEHRALYMNGERSGEAIYAEYVYGTYSRKLLAFWFLVFFLGGMMIGDTVLYRKQQK